MEDVISQAHQWLNQAYQESPCLVNAVLGVLLYVATWHGLPLAGKLGWRAAKWPFAKAPAPPPEPEPPLSQLCQALLLDLAQPAAYEPKTGEMLTAAGASAKFRLAGGDRAELQKLEAQGRDCLAGLDGREAVRVIKAAHDAADACEARSRDELARSLVARLYGGQAACGVARGGGWAVVTHGVDPVPLIAGQPHPLRGGLEAGGAKKGGRA